MPIEEKVVSFCNDMIKAVNTEGLSNKVNSAHSMIVVLYAYLKHLGLSDDEMSSYYNRFVKNDGSLNEDC